MCTIPNDERSSSGGLLLDQFLEKNCYLFILRTRLWIFESFLEFYIPPFSTKKLYPSPIWWSPPDGLLFALHLFQSTQPNQKKINCWFLKNAASPKSLTENLYQMFFCLLEFHKFTFVISGRPRLDLPPFSGHLFQSVWKSASIVENILRASEGLKIRKILQNKNVAKYIKVNHQFPEVICKRVCCMWQNVVQCSDGIYANICFDEV